MAIGARRRIADPGREGLAVYAGSKILRFMIVATTTGFCLSGHMQGREGGSGRDNFVRVMTILARGGISATGFQRDSVHARAVTFRLPLVALAAVHRFGGEIVIRMAFREI